VVGTWAYSNGGEDVGIHVESLLVDARGQCWVQTLGEAQGDRVAVGDDGGIGGMRLEGLQHDRVSTDMPIVCFSQESEHAHLQQAPQERDVVGPFLLGRVPEGQRALDACRIPAEVLVFLIEGYIPANQLIVFSMASSAGPYSPRRRCVQFAGLGLSGQMLAGRTTAG
jgi:hypothetical protein